MNSPSKDAEKFIDVTVKLKLPSKTLDLLDRLKQTYGAHSRGRVIEMLLQELLSDIGT